MEIESRLLPCGLHVVGKPPSATEAIATLVNIAEIDRPSNDPPVKGLPGILARAINRNMEEIYLNSNKVCPRPTRLRAAGGGSLWLRAVLGGKACESISTPASCVRELAGTACACGAATAVC